jgi:hypothetical protein
VVATGGSWASPSTLLDNAAGRLAHGWLAQTVAQGVSITLVTPFAALVGVLLYLDLRSRKEPMDLDTLSVA